MSSSSSQLKPSPKEIRAASEALGALLTSRVKYAVLGGAACQLLGSGRVTEDVDFVVPKGEVKSARKLLAAEPAQFIVDKRTLHTYYRTQPQVCLRRKGTQFCCGQGSSLCEAHSQCL